MCILYGNPCRLVVHYTNCKGAKGKGSKLDMTGPGIIRVHRHSCVTKHGLWSSGGHHNLASAIFQKVGKGSQHAHLHLLLISRHRHQGPLLHFKVIYLHHAQPCLLLMWKSFWFGDCSNRTYKCDLKGVCNISHSALHNIMPEWGKWGIM